MSNFPLYDNLINETPSKALTVAQKKECLSNIQKFDTSGCELAYALIRTYQAQHDKESERIPYSGTLEKNNLTFDLDKLPNKLKQILLHFSRKHLKRMKEESSLPKNKV